MQGKVIVAVALVLAGAGLLTALVPVTQVLYAPVITNQLTNYTTSTTDTVKYVQVVGKTNDTGRPSGQPYIESATYERIADSLRINVTLSHPLSSDLWINVLIFPNQESVGCLGCDFDWEITMAEYGGSFCSLDESVSFTELKTVMDLKSCSVTYRSHAYVASVDVPLYAIGYPTKVYPVVLLQNSPYGEGAPVDWLPDPTDPSLARPEVDLSGEYVHTLTRTFETSSTYTWTYTSPYTANLPIGAKMQWVPILLILGAGLLGGTALVHQRRRSYRNPTESNTGPKDA